MKSPLLLTLALTAAPMAALAMPAVGDVVGTTPTEATTRLASAGCTVRAFEAEGGKIEAKCADPQNHMWEVYIDPKTGAVTNVKADD